MDDNKSVCDNAISAPSYSYSHHSSRIVNIYIIPESELYLNEIRVLGITDRDHCMHLLDQLLLLVVVEVHVPLGQTSFSRSVLNENESNLRTKAKLSTIINIH